MAVAGWVYLLTALLSLSFDVAHSRHGETETYHVSAGYLFLLKCHSTDANANVTWSRGDRDSLSLPTGVEVRDGLLWFLPVQMSHNGTYTCEKRDKTRLWRLKFEVSVSSGKCPHPPENVTIPTGVSGGLPCKQKEIFRLNNIRNIRWMKDCHPLQRQGEPISVDEDGFMRLPKASEEDDGKYTCLIDVSLDGRTYTAARSIQLTVKNVIAETVISEPQMVTPQQDVIIVKVGMRKEVTCLAYTGFAEDSETFMYWIVDGTYAEEYKELNQSWRYIHDKGKVFGLSTLSISKVLRQFLNVPIECHVMSPGGAKFGVAWLQEADHSAFHMSVALCLTASVTVLALAASFFFFKVDLILAHRKLLRHFPKQHVPDGKLYDAYVTFLQLDTPSSDETTSFALHVLPGELEEQHGYSLYIRGRDDCPGEAMHDVSAATVRQCRRLIIILPHDGKTEEATALCDNQKQLSYEQKVGLHDALTQNEPRVILLEIDGPVDYSRLPESLQYIKRKQGALRWRKVFHGTHKLTTLNSNRNFWKNLRYHMPPVPARRLQTIV